MIYVKLTIRWFKIKLKDYFNKLLIVLINLKIIDR